MVAAEAAVEEAEGRHDLKGVALLEARHREAPRHALGPLVEVVLRVGHDDRRARRAGGHVELEEILTIHAIHLQRIGLSEIVLGQERKLLKVVQRLHVLWRGHAASLQTRPIELIPPNTRERLLQPF